jgi:hypothetical protein
MFATNIFSSQTPAATPWAGDTLVSYQKELLIGVALGEFSSTVFSYSILFGMTGSAPPSAFSCLLLLWVGEAYYVAVSPD